MTEDLVSAAQAAKMVGATSIYFKQLARKFGVNPAKKQRVVIDQKLNLKVTKNFYTLCDVEKIRIMWIEKKKPT